MNHSDVAAETLRKQAAALELVAQYFEERDHPAVPQITAIKVMSLCDAGRRLCEEEAAGDRPEWAGDGEVGARLYEMIAGPDSSPRLRRELGALLGQTSKLAQEFMAASCFSDGPEASRLRFLTPLDEAEEDAGDPGIVTIDASVVDGHVVVRSSEEIPGVCPGGLVGRDGGVFMAVTAQMRARSATASLIANLIDEVDVEGRPAHAIHGAIEACAAGLKACKGETEDLEDLVADPETGRSAQDLRAMILSPDLACPHRIGIMTELEHLGEVCRDARRQFLGGESYSQIQMSLIFEDMG